VALEWHAGIWFLSRASMDATGAGAKEYVDRRVLLEAKGLLAHGDQPAAKIAARLGFSCATNLSEFFHRRTGKSPLPAAWPRVLDSRTLLWLLDEFHARFRAAGI
jgi:AraC-like DNA-binding protein